MQTRKVTKSVSTLVAKNMLGDEPTWNSDSSTSLEMTIAFNWYHQIYGNDKPQQIKFLKSYLIKKNVRKEDLSKIDDMNIIPTVCFTAQMINRGCVLEARSLKTFETSINQILEDVRRLVKQEKRIPIKLKMSVQDRIGLQVSNITESFDHVIDEIVETGKKPKFNVLQHLLNHEAKGPHCRQIMQWYEPQHDEIKTIRSDKTLKEGYGLRVKTIVNLIAFLNEIITTCNQIIEQKKVTRKKKRKQSK